MTHLIAPERLTEIGPEAGLASDSLQWILYCNRRPIAWCRTKHGLLSVIRENRLALSEEGRAAIEALPEVFEEETAA